jgi:hypothetical protein
VALWEIKDNGKQLTVASTALSFELDADVTGNLLNLSWHKTGLGLEKIFTTI